MLVSLTNDARDLLGRTARVPLKRTAVNTAPTGPTTALLAEFFTPGIEVADLPALFPLLRAREAFSAFITLFRGGEDEVLVRLLVLREIGDRAQAPRWSPQELQGHLSSIPSSSIRSSNACATMSSWSGTAGSGSIN